MNDFYFLHTVTAEATTNIVPLTYFLLPLSSSRRLVHVLLPAATCSCLILVCVNPSCFLPVYQRLDNYRDF